jgi:uncharacterized Zn finger protein
MSLREAKGRDIADKFSIARHNGLWLVPSQSGSGQYKVNAEKQTCSCPDYDICREKCKHIFAVEVTIKRTHTAVTKNGETTVTETVKVTRKQTYRQEWPAYNMAQTQEKAQFLYLLH